MHKFNAPTPQRMVQYVRHGLIEQEHYGFAMLADREKIIETIGEDRDYPFYLRSCAKPLQASLIIDYGLDEYYDLSLAEIAICCASHAGEKLHEQIAINMMKRIGLTEKHLKCGLHKPISNTAKKALLVSGECESIFQNNCVGKHIMMLAICKMKGWDLDTYYESEHHVQSLVEEKINALCEVKKEYPKTKDGCGVPIMSMPIRKMLKGYLNLFLDPKYEKIKEAFINHPYVVGGEDRLDTKVMEISKNLVAKVGAGGFCIVVNIEREEALLVKISDTDMKAREIAVIDILKNLHWADIEVSHDIKTLHNEVIGKIQTLI